MLAGLCGCANFWDEVTSRDFNIKTVWVKPNPLLVLRDSTDGDLRAKALRALREPKQFGGNDQEQDLYVQILTAAATEDREPLCRLSAIRSLGTFKDPRAVEGLQNAYFNATAFASETNTIIRQNTLTALGETGNPAARELLIRVAREPKVAADASESEKQETLDLRLTALRALANFKQYDVAEALVFVLKTEKDVALRDRAHESLVEATGRKLPSDAKAWEELLSQANSKDGTLAQEPPKKWNVFGWR
jgi:HEAT repeat protein